MIDVGLLLSMIAALGVPSLLARGRVPLRTVGSRSLLDIALPALGIGLLAGRLSALALDDPGGLQRLGDVLIIRSGVEFWPGVAAAMAWVAVAARKDGQPSMVRLADLAPFALWGYAAYEATCVVREGCFGPVSPFGLRPDGLTVTMIPLGLVVAVVVSLAAVGLSRQRGRGHDGLVVVASIGVVATARSVVSFWLPALGQGLTRQHRTSILVASIAMSGLVALAAHARAGAQEDSRVGGTS